MLDTSQTACHDSRQGYDGVLVDPISLFEVTRAPRRDSSVTEDRLKVLLKAAKAIKMSREDKEAQRQSFAYGNTHLENENITRETVAEASRSIKGRKT